MVFFLPIYGRSTARILVNGITEIAEKGENWRNVGNDNI